MSFCLFLNRLFFFSICTKLQMDYAQKRSYNCSAFSRRDITLFIIQMEISNKYQHHRSSDWWPYQCLVFIKYIKWFQQFGTWCTTKYILPVIFNIIEKFTLNQNFTVSFPLGSTSGRESFFLIRAFWIFISFVDHTKLSTRWALLYIYIYIYFADT